MKSYKQRAENMNILSFAEKGRWKSAFGASVLPLGHHREGLLWVAIHRSLQCGTLAGPHKASQKTGQNWASLYIQNAHQILLVRTEQSSRRNHTVSFKANSV